MILARWSEYLQNLLSTVHTTDPVSMDDLQILPIIPKFDDPPSHDELKKVIICLNDNKEDGPDNIPAEFIKYGGCALHRRLTASPLCISHSNEKMPTLFLHTGKRVTEQNVATVVVSPFSPWRAKCWLRSCSSVSLNTL